MRAAADGARRDGEYSVRRNGLAAVAVAVFAVLCCAGLPLLAALVGGVALGTLLGVGAGVLAALVIGVALAARRPSSRLRQRENRQ
jgi:biotin transporter BioY